MFFTIFAIAVLVAAFAGFFVLRKLTHNQRFLVFVAGLVVSNILSLLGVGDFIFGDLCLLVSFDGLLCAFCWAIGGRKLRGWQRTLWFALWVLVSIFFCRLWYAFAKSEINGENWMLVFVENAMEGVRYFTLDAEYGEILADGFSGVYGSLYYALTGILVVAAPLTSATFLFEVATKLYAKMRAARNVRGAKYIFSELNEESIALATSVYKDAVERKERVCIMFADAYRSDDEQWQLLRAKAKEIGALCLEDDVVSLRYKVGKRSRLNYFLINHDEWSNLDLLLLLMKKLDEDEGVELRKAKETVMYVFSHNEEADIVAKGLFQKEKERAKTRNERSKFVIKVVRDATALAYNLLQNYPLFIPFENTKAGEVEEKLSVAVLGSGKIGREFFATAYWCGQMLDRQGKKMPFSISVFSADADEFEEQLKFEMPEVFDGQSLREGRLGKWNYCDLGFYKAEFGTQSFYENFEKHCKDCNYVLVAMGDDELNFRAATWLNRYLDRYYCNSPVRPVVNFVLESEEFCALLKERYEREGKSKGANNAQCIVNAFGSLAERYDFKKSIFTSELETKAAEMDFYYNQNRHKIPVSEEETDEPYRRELGYVEPANTGAEEKRTFTQPSATFLSDGYRRRSSMASVVHRSYKCFAGEGGNAVEVDVMMGVEHCRWTAFVRSGGYRAPSAQEFLTFCRNGDWYNSRSHAQKIHACLTDCDYADYHLNLKVWAFYFLITEKQTEFIYPEIPRNAEGTSETFLSDWRKAWQIANGATLKQYPLLNACFDDFSALDDLTFFQLAISMRNYQQTRSDSALEKLKRCADTKLNDRNAVVLALGEKNDKKRNTMTGKNSL